MDVAALQTQLYLLQQQVTLLQAQNASLQQSLEESRRELTGWRQKFAALARRLFGSKSEQLDAAQLQLLLAGLTQQAVAPAPQKSLPAMAAPRRERKASQRVITPENLEVVREVIEPDVVKAEPEQWQRIDEEVSRQLDFQPAKFFWRETVRPKYVRADDRSRPPVVASAPVRVSDRCLAAPGLLAHLLVSKYADPLPFYRLQTIFWQRQGVFIARQQMGLWVGQCVVLLEAIVVGLQRELQHSPYVQVDETPVRYREPETPGQCAQGYLWTALVPGQCVVYEWHPSRAAACLDSLLGNDFKGKLQCDGYSAYPAFAKDKKDVALFGCWAHARRGFWEAREQAPGVAGWILNQIGILYGWEAELRESRAGPGAREARRASHSRMVVARLKRALEKLRPRYLPKSPLGQAISYALNQWPVLERFREHGEVEADNNLVENAIRPTAVGKKNWLCFGSDEAGTRNATVFTLVQNCRMHGVNPYEYLKEMLERLPRMTNQDDLSQLTPLNWKKARQQSLRQAA
ncbi:MAG: IS66 family transposase [Verrucomicrobiae bacterium]|nr:IS66 family transposase [Verrucomicrobiae bacterium]